MEWAFLAVCLLALSGLTASSSAPLVNAPWGSVEGVAMEGPGGRRLNAYLGIPYALPPTGPLRWQKPQPHPGPGEGRVFVADTYSAACPQVPDLGLTVPMSEDCLTLNVYVPTTVTSPKPVMLWIHGGGLVMGEAPVYRPFKFVVNGDVIVVSIHYRLAALGFLSSGDDTLPGNLGLWDQNLALRWVKDNIRAFGGDADVVTLFGESAGSWSTGLQMVSPYSKGLFQRAVLQSGSPQTSVSIAAPEKAAFDGISGKLGCDGESDLKKLDCMRTKSCEEIINATREFESETGNMLAVSARVDGDFIPRNPLELVQDETYVLENGIGDLDIITGFNNREGAILLMGTLLKGGTMESLTHPAVFNGILASLGVKLFSDRKSDGLLSSIAEFFYRKADFGTTNPVPLDTLLDMYGDLLFNAPAIQFLRPLVSLPHTGARYLYLFDHDFAFNKNVAPGTHHGDEMILEFEIEVPEDSVFARLNKSADAVTDEEQKLGVLFVDILTTFAKTGNPNSAVKSVLRNDWSEFTTEDEAYLSLSLSPEMKSDVMKDRIALWTKLIPEVISARKRKQEQSTENPGKDEL